VPVPGRVRAGQQDQLPAQRLPAAGRLRAQVNTWLAAAFAPARLSDTIDQIVAGQQAHADRAAAQAAMAKIEDASVKMARYRVQAGRSATTRSPRRQEQQTSCAGRGWR